jgi:hypothetical protein
MELLGVAAEREGRLSDSLARAPDWFDGTARPRPVGVLDEHLAGNEDSTEDHGKGVSALSEGMPRPVSALMPSSVSTVQPLKDNAGRD